MTWLIHPNRSLSKNYQHRKQQTKSLANYQKSDILKEKHIWKNLQTGRYSMTRVALPAPKEIQ